MSKNSDFGYCSAKNINTIFFYFRKVNNMSRITKKKHVLNELHVNGFEHPGNGQKIARILCSRGNNLHEVETECNECFLVSMPTKFRKAFWIKRGDFVIVDQIKEGVKVKGEIIRILSPEHVKQLTKDGIWPKKFTKQEEPLPTPDEHNSADSSEDDDDIGLFRNPNRRKFEVVDESTSDSESDTSSNEDSDDDEEDV